MRRWILLLALLTAGCASKGRTPAPPPEPTAEPMVTPVAGTPEDARAFYRSQPRYLQPVVLGTELPAGLPDLRASTCGACHTEIYAEWSISTHARAWLDDAQFQAELHKERPNDGDVSWMCINCHTPLEAQQERLVVGLQDGRLDRPLTIANPAYDAELQLDAITCATCHLRDGVIVGPYGDTNAPHATAKGQALTTEQVCVRCHEAEATFPELVLACAFTTGSEFADSPAAQQGKICQDCHMPEVDRPLMAGFPERPTRRHWFGGSLIPKRPEDEGDVAPLRDVYPDGLTLALAPLPDSAVPGESVTVSATYTNAEAGHRLPTGDPERFLTIELVARGPDGAALARSDARVGTKYQWYPEVKKLDDNRLMPGESRSLELTLTAPATGPITVEAIASKYRIGREALEYHHLDGKYPDGREFAREVGTISIR
jgi:hypothetical protein